MSDAHSDDRSLTGSALLDQLRKQMAAKLPGTNELFRVVEIARDSSGRLVAQGRIWHADLDHVRRFGRAVAANSVSQKVVIADAAGAVVENIPLAPAGSAPAGWEGWKDLVLPPAPPRKKPRSTPAKSRPVPAAPAAATAAPVPAAATPAVAVFEAKFDAAATATLPPGAAPARPAAPAEAVAAESPPTVLP